MLTIRPAQFAALREARCAMLRDRLVVVGVAPGDVDRVSTAAAEYRIISHAGIVRFADLLVRGGALPELVLSKPAINALSTHGSGADERLARFAELLGVPEAQGASPKSNASATADDGIVVPCVQAPATAEKAVHWIEIVLVGDDQSPVAWEEYRVELPDGEAVKGFLDEHGFARINAIASPGQCRISFPRLDRRSWDRDERSVGS